MPVPHVVTLVGHFSVPPAHADAFRENCRAMVRLRGKEPGHLASAHGFGADGAAVSREDYVSAEAVRKHMELGSQISQSTRELVEITGAEVHGPAEEIEKLRDLFQGMPVRFFVTEYGFWE
ncbi:hypothetical protein FGK63_03475 [Ruegeria sediminis]|uniref:ABM domain-containing protein n=1 Tax=Ruegeria sediminis TaxID=2583820 RepID=A0ABY2X4X1_9RHOB|nr:antibiotic biosynthesis monooxygenase [Ruegeria sediminis]TMV10133.1 hypothetical protein FGK63_03475 [Ruegeria sediminis]